jgi:flagellar biosynthesis/type III secretory pathway protein FliH
MPLAYLVRHPDRSIEWDRRVIKARELEPLLDAAQVIARCETLVSEIEAGARQRYDEAYRRGLEEGRREGLARCGDTLAALEARCGAYFEALDATLIDLAVNLVRAVAPRAGAAAMIAAWVEEALPSLRHDRMVAVRVHPDNTRAVREALAATREERPSIACFDVVDDPTVDLYACVIESDEAVARTGLDDRLESVRRAFEAARPGEERSK